MPYLLTWFGLKQIELWVLVPEGFFFFFLPLLSNTESASIRSWLLLNRHIFSMMGVAALIMFSRSHSTQPVCVECSPGEAILLKQLGLVMLHCYFTQVTTWELLDCVSDGTCGTVASIMFAEQLTSQTSNSTHYGN